MKKAIIYIIVAVVALALIFWKLENNKQENQQKVAEVQKTIDAVPVLVDTVTKTLYNQSFIANGNFIADKQLNFMSETSGRITSILVKEGDRVRKGQLLARIDNALLASELQSAEVQLEQLQKDRQRYQNALQTGGVSQKQLDDIEMQLKVKATQIESIRKRIAYTYVNAPISGVINKKHIEVGSYMSPGMQMFDIVSLSDLKLSVNVPSAKVVKLHEGKTVNINSDVFPETDFVGKITFLAVKGDNSLNYPVEISLMNTGGKQLKAGMFGTAHFDLNQEEPGILIPRSAFVGGVGSNQVFVVESGKAQLRKVVSGKVIDDKVEILSGLQEGEVVITSGQINLVNGVKVQKQGV